MFLIIALSFLFDLFNIKLKFIINFYAKSRQSIFTFPNDKKLILSYQASLGYNFRWNFEPICRQPDFERNFLPR